jgi:serine/threonine protein kinase
MEVSLESFKKRYQYDSKNDLLGKGGFGEVYRAYDTEDDIYVALKIGIVSADNKYDISSEIKKIKKLYHPNIVNHIEVYDVKSGSSDIHGNPLLYQVGVLEYADGGTLSDYIQRGNTDRATLDIITADILAGLQYLHANDIIHRDIKPSNILLFKDGDSYRAKIADFGIAKNINATMASTQLIGTMEYMAPEYFTTGQVTKASDMWSIGVMLVELYSGVHPFGKNNQGVTNEQIIQNILNKSVDTTAITAKYKPMVDSYLHRDASIRSEEVDLSGYTKIDNIFDEKTRVIAKKLSQDTPPTKTKKLKKWSRDLLNFDLSSQEKQNKLVAREFLLILGIGFSAFIVSIISIPMFNGTIYTYSEIRKKIIENQCPTRDSIEKVLYIKTNKQKEFSAWYFPWGYSDMGERVFMTPIAVIYQAYNELVPNPERLSYLDFAHYLKEASNVKSQATINQYNRIRSKLEYENSEDLSYNFENEIESKRNLELDGTDNFLADCRDINWSYIPNRIVENKNKPGWIEWFRKNRILGGREDTFFNINELWWRVKYNALNPKKFDKNIRDLIVSSAENKCNCDYQKYDNFYTLNSIRNNDAYTSFENIFKKLVYILLILFFPFRLFFVFITWAIKTIRS